MDFGRDLCAVPAFSARREWLVTNGIGGFASGSVAGCPTRRYHGLLVAALHPPLGRTLVVSHLDEAVRYDGRAYPLSTHRWDGGIDDWSGLASMERFHLEETAPVWTFACGDALLEKRVWMVHGANTTCVRYAVLRSRIPLVLTLKALVNYRDYHGTTHAGDWRMRIDPAGDGLRVTAFDGATPLLLRCDGADVQPQHDWYHGYFLQAEADRGLDAVEDHLLAGTFEATLPPGGSITFVASTEPEPYADADAGLAAQRSRAAGLVAAAGLERAPAGIRQLVLAADQFVVARSTPVDPAGRTLIAGYPWFSDWGRDTMISLPGLTLSTGRPEVAASILRTFGHYVSQGMLPNRFPDAGEAPEYNTVDATLWYVEALRAYHAATDDDVLLRDLFPVLQEILDWHERGTRYGIHVDPGDGLLHAGEPGVQLTWMDARVDGREITPRTGKAVEINALWYNALRSIAAFARRLGASDAACERAAERVQAAFGRFWNEAAAYCYDVIDGPDGDDAAVRPNAILAVSLYHSPLDPIRQKAVVETCTRHLVTPHGLRSLSPDDGAYAGRYGGDARSRDAVYHQGTVWAWLMGPFVAAHLKVYHDPVVARSYLDPLLRHLSDHGLGSISEIFDGDAPFAPNGCPAQAWSVAEVLRASLLTGAAPEVSSSQPPRSAAEESPLTTTT